MKHFDWFYYSRCRKLPKALKQWQAYEDLRKTIDDFNEACPLLEMMANKAMQIRHWDRIAAVTHHTFDMESGNFLLKNLMEAPLLENKEDIEVRLFFSFAWKKYRIFSPPSNRYVLV